LVSRLLALFFSDAISGRGSVDSRRGLIFKNNVLGRIELMLRGDVPAG